MGFQHFKRPIDVRTKGATDIKFDTATSTGDIIAVSLTASSSVVGGTASFTSGIAAVTYKRTSVATATSASTAVTTRGVLELGTSSTTAAANYILSVPAAAGEELTLVLKPHGSTYGVTVNASTATAVTFGAVTATTAQIQLVLAGTLGSAAHLISLSTARWLVTANVGGSFTTAAA